MKIIAKCSPQTDGTKHQYLMPPSETTPLSSLFVWQKKTTNEIIKKVL
jgi:hypothetical protein